MASEKQVTFNMRLEPELRAAFLRVCAGRDRTAAQEVRAMMREYVKRYAQGEQPMRADKRDD